MKTKKKTVKAGPVTIDRMTLLRNLEAVLPGLSKKETVEQGGCLAFVNKWVWTFNGEVACRTRSGLPAHVEGAVHAQPLLACLRDMPDDEVVVDLGGGELSVKGRRHYADVRTEAEVTLPIGKIDRPGQDDWKPLPDDFGTAVGIVQECVGKDETQFAFTCVHVHPKWLEACDNIQITRYRLKTPVKRAFIVKRDNIKHVVGLDMTEFAETGEWVHFRNASGVHLSCLRHVEDYPDLSPHLKVDGTPTTLPKGIDRDAKFAEIFSKEVEDRNLVLVDLKPGQITVRGIGVSGRNGVRKKAKYAGKPLAFAIAPALLGEVTKRHTEVEITPTHMKVSGDKWVFVTCLELPDDAEKKQSQAAEAAALADEEPTDE